MLNKCFKYDFKSVFKIWWIAAVTVLTLSVAAGFCLKNLSIYSTDPDRVFILEFTVIFIYYFSIIAIGLFSAVLLGIRFYSNFFSDEGYLTFTLPVKRTTLFISKILNGFVFELLSLLTVFLSLIIIALIMPSFDKTHITALGSIVGGLIEFVRGIPKNEIIWFIIYVAEAVLFATLLLLSGVLLIYMLITLGSTAVKRFKAAATVGFLVGANYVLSALIIPAFFAFGLWMSSSMYLYEDRMNGSAGFSLFALLFLFLSIVLATAGAFFANVTQGCLERKLNLS